MDDYDSQNENTKTDNANEVPEETSFSNPEVNQDSQVSSEETAQKKKISKKTLLIVCILALLLIGGAGAAYYFLSDSSDSDDTSLQTEQQEEMSTDDDVSAFVEIPLTSARPEYKNSVFDQQSGEVWLSERKQIDKPQSLSNVPEYEENYYYEVGTRAGKTIIMHAVVGLGEYVEFYEIDDSNKATLIANFNNQFTDAEGYFDRTAYDKANIEIDTETIYDSLTLPVDEGFKLDNDFTLSVNRWATSVLDVKNEKGGVFNKKSDFLKTATEIQKTKNGAFYQLKKDVTYEDPQIDLAEVAFYYITPVGTSVSLSYKPYDSMLVKDFTFTRGSIHPDDKSDYGTYDPITRGCGLASAYSLYPKITDKDLVKVGTGKNGEPVYGLVDTDYKILTKYVEEIAQFTESNPDKQELLDNNAIIFHKNVRGEWEVYGSPHYTQFGGCAKPVVYLYPETTSLVDVAVGADVKISDPYYPNGGWKSVVAQPNGTLHYQGKVYDSLFWEGPGNGHYPAITSGTIVETKDALSTIKSHMRQMGFNDKETADFVDYWKDKLPTKRYTRLTWFQTSEMDQLAPLYVSGNPDTILRAFLDFEGLSKPYALPQQTLTTTERTGFTVTEWGGFNAALDYSRL